MPHHSVPKHLLSSESGQVISVAEPEGLELYLWSEEDTDDHGFREYLGPQSRLLQGLLPQARNFKDQLESLARAELMLFVGRRFQILAS